MKKHLILTFLFCFGIYISNTLAQENETSWEAIVSTESLLMGNRMKVTFKLKNGDGRNFQAPTFNGFQIMSGPNQSTAMTIINGNMSRESSYSYYLAPVEEGTFYIEPAAIEVDGVALETLPIEILVMPNPDGIEQEIEEADEDRLQWNQLPWSKPEAPGKKKNGKKKRRIYKI